MYALLMALACSCSDPTPPPPGPAPAEADEGYANVGVARVTEALHGDGRSYLRIDEAGYDFWVSVPRLEVQVGDAVLLGRGPLRTAVRSAELGREFPVLTEIERAERASAEAAAAVLAPPPGGVAIGELYARRAELAGKPVKVRGRVVKANLGIFGKNWYHLRDGTGAPGSDDLTVNGAATLAVGDVVVAEGPLGTDRDFGFGYFFSAILEDAQLQAEGAAEPAAPTAAPAAGAAAPGSVAEAPAASAAAPASAAAVPAASAAAPGSAAEAPTASAAAPASAAERADGGRPAPSRAFLGLSVGTLSAEELAAWLAEKGLRCTTAPSPRRATIRTVCEDELPVSLLTGRTVSGKWAELLFSRTDGGPIHYIAAARRYSIPADAALDFETTAATLTRSLGAPTTSHPLDKSKLDAKLFRYSVEWRFSDLEVRVSLLKAGSPWVSVNETWAVPGVEAATPARGGGAGHFGASARPEGWNPHVSAP